MMVEKKVHKSSPNSYSGSFGSTYSCRIVCLNEGHHLADINYQNSGNVQLYKLKRRLRDER